jgi:hypothetical protein
MGGETAEANETRQITKAVSYWYERMRRKKQKNLVEYRAEVGTGELGLDDRPDPVEGRAKSNVRRIRLPCSTIENGKVLANDGDNYGTRISDLGERTRVVIEGKYGQFDRIPVCVVGEVVPRLRLESISTADGCERGTA